MHLRASFVAAAMLSTSALASPALSPQPGERGIGLAATAASRSASLLEGVTLDATLKPSLAPPLGVLDGLRFALADPLLPLPQGAAVGAGVRPVLALFLGLIVGFGLGHLIARDRDGFVLFLIVDLVLVAVSGVLNYTIWPLGGLAWIALLVSHIIQGLDAYGRAGGGRIVEWTREHAVEVASSEEREAPVTTRAFALQF